MSETDSFIQEVSEEVRKDRLFALMRKYGWIAVLVVLLVVSGTAYREYSITTDALEAQKTGDAILAALCRECWNRNLFLRRTRLSLEGLREGLRSKQGYIAVS